MGRSMTEKNLCAVCGWADTDHHLSDRDHKFKQKDDDFFGVISRMTNKTLEEEIEGLPTTEERNGGDKGIKWVPRFRVLALVNKHAQEEKAKMESLIKELRAAGDWKDYHNPVGAASCYDKTKIEAIIEKLEAGENRP